jgi:phenylacetate-CoA ligase
MSFRIVDIYRGTNIVETYKFYQKRLSNNTFYQTLLLDQKKNLTFFLRTLKSNKHYSYLLNSISYSDIEFNPYGVLKQLPLMDKGTITNNFESIKNIEYKYEKTFTGGSTGRPFHYLIDKNTISETRGFSYALWNKFLGYNLGDRIIVVAGNSLGKNETLFQKVYNRLQNKHFISNVEKGFGEAKMLADYINKSRKACFIYAYPSTLVQLLAQIKEFNIKIDRRKVLGVICTSEMLFENQKESIKQFFQTEVLNMYGANDGGIVSGSTDNVNFIYNGLGCFVENVFIEGQNEIVLTSLFSFAFPFVRYRVGDIGDVVNDSKDYPFVIRNLIGRSRDLIYIDKYKRVHGSEFNKIFKKYPAIIEYQIEQFRSYNCIIRIVCDKSMSSLSIKEKLYDDIKTLLFGIPFKIEIVNSIKKRGNGKHKNIITHVN